MAILWGTPPPKKLREGSIHLLAIRAGETYACCVLGPMVGLQTHWAGGRSVPCTESDCRVHDCPITWKGYVPVIVDGHTWNGACKGSFPWVLIVTEEIGEDATAWRRGLCLQVMRPGKKSNGALAWNPLTIKTPDPLRPTFDVRPFVLRAAGLPQTVGLRVRRAE